MRGFDDGTGVFSEWWEFQPDQFWCGLNQADAKELFGLMPHAGVSASRLRRSFGSDLRPLEGVQE